MKLLWKRIYEMKEFIRIGLFTIVGALALLAQGPPPGGHGGGPGGPGGPGGMALFGAGHGAPVTGAPFSATAMTQMQQTLADGNQITNQTQIKLYRDSAGRTRTETTFTDPSGATESRVMIFDPVAGYAISLDPANLTAVKHTLPPAGSMPKASERPEPPTGAATPQKVDLGTKTIAGLEATGTRSTMTIPAGQMGNAEAIQVVRETWTSSALKIPVMVTSTDPRRGTSTMQLTDIAQKEPDQSLFQIPSNYKVTTQAGRSHEGPPPPPGQ